MVNKIKKKAEQLRDEAADSVNRNSDWMRGRISALVDILVYIDILERAERISVAERFGTVLEAAEKAVGTRLTERRTMESNDIRMLVVKQMRDEGYSNASIGRLIHRDHSTVSYLYRCVNEMLALSVAFSKFMHIYDQFKKNLGQ